MAIKKTKALRDAEKKISDLENELKYQKESIDARDKWLENFQEQKMKLKKQSYKIDLSWIKGKAREVLSESVQKKAFELGFRWHTEANRPKLLKEPYLFFAEDNNIYWCKDKDGFEKPDKYIEFKFVEVSVNDWLNCEGFEEEKKADKINGAKKDFINLDDLKDGSTARYKGKLYKVFRRVDGCKGCDFDKGYCVFSPCLGKNITFKKV